MLIPYSGASPRLTTLTQVPKHKSPLKSIHLFHQANFYSLSIWFHICFHISFLLSLPWILQSRLDWTNLATRLRDEKGLGEEHCFRKAIAKKSPKEKQQLLEGIDVRKAAVKELGYAFFRFPRPPKEMLQHPDCPQELKSYETCK